MQQIGTTDNFSWSPSAQQILRDCEKTLQAIAGCRASDGTKCAPTELDFQMVNATLMEIAQYFEDRRIGYWAPK